MKEKIDEILSFLLLLDIKYYLLIAIILLFCIILLIVVKKRKKKKNNSEITVNNLENEKTKESFGFKEFKEKHTNDDIIGIEKKKSKKKLSKKEKLIEEQREICISLYNVLYNFYYTENYTVELSENDILNYYYNKIYTLNNVEELKDLEHQISFQTTAITQEINLQKKKIQLEIERKQLYNACVVKIKELEFLYKTVKFEGSGITKEYNDKLLSFGIFSTNEEYQLLYNEIMQTIVYTKIKYEKVLNKLGGDTFEEVDLKLTTSLKALEVDINERDLSKIKAGYIKLVRKYHPDKNLNNVEAERKMSEINEAWKYINDILKK